RRDRERMRVHPEVERTVDILTFAIEANRLADRQDVRFVERAVERGAAMPRGAERDSLRGIVGVGLAGEVSGDQTRNIDQLRLIDRFSGQRAYFLGHEEETSSPGVMCDRFPGVHCQERPSAAIHMERVIGFEPTTSCLASTRSTN